MSVNEVIFRSIWRRTFDITGIASILVFRNKIVSQLKLQASDEDEVFDKALNKIVMMIKHESNNVKQDNSTFNTSINI